MYFYYFQNFGITEERNFKYVAQTIPCPSINHLPRSNVKVANIVSGPANELQLADTLYNHSPIAIGMRVDAGFVAYKEGIYSSNGCDQCEGCEHCLVLMGYGTDARLGDYWILRNSWDITWGERGYGKIARGKNMCAIGRFDSSYAEVAKH